MPSFARYVESALSAIVALCAAWTLPFFAYFVLNAFTESGVRWRSSARPRLAAKRLRYERYVRRVEGLRCTCISAAYSAIASSRGASSLRIGVLNPLAYPFGKVRVRTRSTPPVRRAGHLEVYGHEHGVRAAHACGAAHPVC